MRITPFRRLTAALTAIWLALVLAELPALHVCSVHRLASNGDLAASGASKAAAAHTAHHPEGQSHHHGKQCNCLDSANQSPTLALLSHRASLVAEPPVVAQIALLLPPADETFPPPPEFRLPFPNGPPAFLSTPPHAAA